jgi:hypothetical protein
MTGSAVRAQQITGVAGSPQRHRNP